MYSKTLSFTFSLIASTFILFAGHALADKPLKSTLDLNTGQTAEVAAIQKEARDAIRKPRGELKRKERALRRARQANDSTAIAQLEKEILPLRVKMRQIYTQEEQKIRKILTPEQTINYEQWLKEREQMVGSSRDVKE